MEMILDRWTAQCILGGSDFLDREKLAEYQRIKLIETVTFAKENAPFYRKLLGNRIIATLDDLSSLPFTYPKDCGEKMICVPQREISRVVTLDTSGTTGKPKRIFFTEEDQQLTIDYFRHGMQHIVGSADCLLIAMPCKIPGSVGDLIDIGVRGFGARTIPFGLIGDEDTLNQAAHIMMTQPVDALVGLPSQLVLLAQQTPNFRCKTVLLSAEYVSQEAVAFIEAQWNCQVFEHYGMTEMGLGCAVSCPTHEGYHVRESDLYLEIIDPETGKPVADGVWGEVVFTTLTRRAMPFIRYRTGDISRWIEEPCGCGSKLKRLDKVHDRKMKKGSCT